MAHFEHMAKALGLGALVVLLGGYLLARLLRRRHLRASWAALALPLSYAALGLSSLGLLLDAVLAMAVALGVSWLRQDSTAVPTTRRTPARVYASATPRAAPCGSRTYAGAAG